MCQVCCVLRDPAIRLHEIEISLFSPFRPMLGDQADPNKVAFYFQAFLLFFFSFCVCVFICIYCFTLIVLILVND